MRSLLLIQIHFFYFETEILDYECEKKGDKRLYNTRDKSSPSSKCCDKSGIFKFGRKKPSFQTKCNFESTSYFLELMGEGKIT